jgi:TolB-like protein/class 3 adenylate cyclase
MGEQGVTRRLAAIMVVDVVGYSHFMEADETGTLARLKSHQTEIIDPRLAAHHGDLVKTMGDGLLVEFSSAFEALACATEIQRTTARRNNDVPEELRVEYRIGVNLGDIIVENDDIFGHGVNVASRLESLAEPGSVYISRPVYDQVKGKLDVEFEYLGEQKFHNIDEPVQTYRVLLDASAPPPKATAAAAKSRAESSRTTWLVAGAALIAVVAVGLVLGRDTFLPSAPDDTVTVVDETAGPTLPDIPSIAVLPFNNMSDDPTQEYFSDGITEDLITDISKVSGLFVVARNSTFSYKGKSVDVRQIARELGVRYVLEGSVRRAGEQVRVNAQLIDATTGGHVWADRYDGSVADVFELQDKVTRKIVNVLAVQLTTGEQDQIAHRETENSDAYDSFLKGWEQYQLQRPESIGQAIGHFEKAVELDPQYSRAYAALSATYWQAWKRFWQARLGMRIHEPQFLAEEILEKAMHDPTPLALQTAASMLAQQGQHADALSEGERAVAMDPNDADSYVALAGALSLAGQSKKAMELIERAMRLNPHYPPSYLYELGLARFGLGQFAEAANALEKATALNPDDRWSSRLLLATYGHLGRAEDAANIFEAAERNWRGFDPRTVRGVAFWYPFMQPADAERLAEGLRRANVPD